MTPQGLAQPGSDSDSDDGIEELGSEKGKEPPPPPPCQGDKSLGGREGSMQDTKGEIGPSGSEAGAPPSMGASAGADNMGSGGAKTPQVNPPHLEEWEGDSDKSEGLEGKNSKTARKSRKGKF